MNSIIRKKRPKQRFCRSSLFMTTTASLFNAVVCQADPEINKNIFELSLEELLNIKVVSATRTETNLLDSPVPVSVITAQEIADSGLDTLPDILNRLPEIDVLRIGRAQQEVSIRGKGVNFSRRLLILIDGRSEYNELFGVTFWNALPIGVNDIARIEVVRGPASALFGANAYSGVINIITKKSEQATLQTNISLDAGNEGHQTASILLLSGKGDTEFRFSAGTINWENSKTEVSFPGFNGIPTTDNFSATKESLDSMVRISGEFKLNIDDNQYFDFKAGNTDGSMEMIFQPGLPRSTWQISNTFAELAYSLSADLGNFDVKVNINHFNYETPLLPTTAEVNAFPNTDGRFFYPSFDMSKLIEGKVNTLHTSILWSSSALENQFNYVTGFEYRKIDSRNGFLSNKDKNISSLFGNFVYPLKNNWQIGLGIRADKDNVTDTNYSYNSNLRYAFNETHSIRATLRQAFRAPTLFEQFSTIDLNVVNQNQRVQFRGNPALEVENINAFDITWTNQLSENFHYTLELFREEYSGLIGNPDSGLLEDVILNPETNIFTTTTSFQNLGDASSNGIQASIIWLASSDLRLNSGYRYTHPDNLNSLPGETFFTPQHKFNLGVTWQVSDQWRLVNDLITVSKTDNSEFPVGNISPTGPNFARDNQTNYSKLNLALHYSPIAFDGLRFRLVIDNLSDDKHVEYYEFDQVLKAVGEEFGREVWGGFTWQF